MNRDSKINLDRAGERGAALVTMLLVSVLLLGAGGALIMTTTMSANNSLASTAAMQAYYVAESGMQSALNALRGNTRPLINTTDRMSFRTAIIPSISNGGNAGSQRLAAVQRSRECKQSRAGGSRSHHGWLSSDCREHGSEQSHRPV